MKFILLLSIILFTYLFAEAQQDSLKNTNNSAAVSLMKQVEQLHIADSLKEMLLMEQMASLQQSEAKQRQLIQNQLKELQKNDSLQNKSFQKRIDSLKRHAKGAPILIGTDTLCHFYTNIGSFTAEERAIHCQERILQDRKSVV